MKHPVVILGGKNKQFQTQFLVKFPNAKFERSFNQSSRPFVPYLFVAHQIQQPIPKLRKTEFSRVFKPKRLFIEQEL